MGVRWMDQLSKKSVVGGPIGGWAFVKLFSDSKTQCDSYRTICSRYIRKLCCMNIMFLWTLNSNYANYANYAAKSHSTQTYFHKPHRFYGT